MDDLCVYWRAKNDVHWGRGWIRVSPGEFWEPLCSWTGCCSTASVATQSGSTWLSCVIVLNAFSLSPPGTLRTYVLPTIINRVCFEGYLPLKSAFSFLPVSGSSFLRWYQASSCWAQSYISEVFRSCDGTVTAVLSAVFLIDALCLSEGIFLVTTSLL